MSTSISSDNAAEANPGTEHVWEIYPGRSIYEEAVAGAAKIFKTAHGSRVAKAPLLMLYLVMLVVRQGLWVLFALAFWLVPFLIIATVATWLVVLLPAWLGGGIGALLAFVGFCVLVATSVTMFLDTIEGHFQRNLKPEVLGVAVTSMPDWLRREYKDPRNRLSVTQARIMTMWGSLAASVGLQCLAASGLAGSFGQETSEPWLWVLQNVEWLITILSLGLLAPYVDGISPLAPESAAGFVISVLAPLCLANVVVRNAFDGCKHLFVVQEGFVGDESALFEHVRYDYGGPDARMKVYVSPSTNEMTEYPIGPRYSEWSRSRNNARASPHA